MRRLLAVVVLLAPLTALGQAQTYYFTAAPRQSAQEGAATYGPIADLLTAKTGRKFVYLHSNNWLSYQKDMRDARFHVIFDDPHFVSWRVLRMSHTPLVRLPGRVRHVVIVRSEDNIPQTADLAGYRVCANPPPDLGTLSLLSRFKNPFRLPDILETRINQMPDRLLKNSCRGAVMSTGVWQGLETAQFQGKFRVLFESEGLPNQALTVDPRIQPKVREQIQQAILSPDGKIATTRLRGLFVAGEDLVETSRDEYIGFAYLLEEHAGFRL